MQELLNELRTRGVTLWLDGDKMRYRGLEGAMTPEILQRLRLHKLELIAFLRGKIGQEQNKPVAIRRSSSTDPAPASSAQTRFWFVSRLDPENPAYNIPEAFEIQGPLDYNKLQDALTEVTRRHEALRTTLIGEEGGVIRQRISPPDRFTVPIIEIQPQPGISAREIALQRLREWGNEVFDLEAGPLFCARLLKLGTDHYILYIALHHAIGDGWSLHILHRELADYYAAGGVASLQPLPELPIQYSDFARAQAERVTDAMFERESSYWKNRLRGAPPFLELPHDFPRAAAKRSLGGSVQLVISAELWQSLGQLARSEGGTHFMVLVATFQVLLGCLAGVDDIVIGTPVAGRQQVETQGLIGVFLNNLPLRGDLSGSPTFRGFLHQTVISTLDALAHQEIPFDLLVTQLNPERSLSRAPLFQVLINQLEQSVDSLDLPGLEVEPLTVFDLFSKYDLSLYSNPRVEGTFLELVYNKELFSRARAGVILEQFENLLRQVVKHPELPLNSYSLVTNTVADLLPDPEKAVEKPRQEGVLERFETIVRKYPNRMAIAHGSRAWTYTELSQAVGKIAGILGRAGIKSRDVVAITGPSSPGLVAALLAVWELGAAFTLVDPRLPDARKKIMCEQSRAVLWLQIGPGAMNLQLPPGLPVCELPADFESLPASLPFERARCEEAYIFFTSGTTGIPKAVLGTHQGLGHFLNWQRSTFGVGPGDRIAQLTGLSFDVILRDLFLPLTAGATLCIPKFDGDLAGDRVIPWLEREHITILHSVPSLAASWIASDCKSTPCPLRWVFFAGEPLGETLLQGWRKKFVHPGGIVNLYGPTETTLAKFSFVVPDPALPGIQPVGRPMPQTQALILNQAGKLCGVGEPGEIVIRTPFHAAGYLNNPVEQDRKFRANPFRADPADLVYYTGDRGRYSPDGMVEILGRVDRQVKVNGVRIELDEVNLAISGCDGVTSSTVLAQTNTDGSNYLVAYISGPVELLDTLAATVRHHLSRTLPSALVPSQYVTLERMPLTANGKVDYTALPVPGSGRSVTQLVSPPSGPIEESIANIFKDYLPRIPIDCDRSFFDLGGHSLLGLQILARIRQTFGRDISLRQLFLEPTIRGLARVVAETAAPEVPLPAWCRSIHALQPGGRRPPLYIFPGGNGGEYELYVHARFATQYLGLDQPVFAFKSRGAGTGNQCQSTMAEMVKDYLAELRQVQPRGPYFFLGDCLGGNIAFALACALQQDGEDVPFLALADCARPRLFDFERHWLSTRAKRFRVSVAGRILFNWHRLLMIVTPSGRRWLREKMEPRINLVPEQPKTPLKPVPELEYWSPQGERYRRTVSTFKPGIYRGKLRLVVSSKNQSDPLLMAWGENSSEGIEQHVLPGDHWTYLWEGAPELARICRAALDAEIHRRGI